MATCKLCWKKSIFLSVNNEGICQNCSSLVALEVKSKFRVIDESLAIVKKSTKMETQLSRCDVISDLANSLLKYEKLGISTLTPNPSVLILNMKEAKMEISVTRTTQDIEKIMIKANLSVTTSTKINEATKALVLIENSYKSFDEKPKELVKLEKEIIEFIAKTQFENYVDLAEKAEFKGQASKAIDFFKEALYFLSSQPDSTLTNRDELTAKIQSSLERLETS
jgi:hypothetical protein